MHWTTFTRAKRRTSCGRTSSTLGARTLENRLSRDGTSRCRPALRRTRSAHIGRTGGWRTNRGRINRTRSGLRNDQSARRHMGNGFPRSGLVLCRSSRFGYLRLRLWFSLCGNLFHRFFGWRRSDRRLRRHHDTWCLARLRCNQARSGRRCSRGCRQFGFGLSRAQRKRFFNLGLTYRSNSNRRRRSHRHLGRRGWFHSRRSRLRWNCGRRWRRSCRLRCHGGWRSRLCRHRGWCGRLGGSCRRCLLLQDRLQCIARLGDVREIKLRLKFLFPARSTRSRFRR